MPMRLTHAVTRGRRAWILPALATAAILLLVDVTYRAQSGPRSPQSFINERYAIGSPSPWSVISNYPRHFTPLYPIVLVTAVSAGLPHERVNEILFVVAIVVFWLVARRAIGSTLAPYAVLLFAVAHFNYVNFYQYTAEALFVPLLLLLLLALMRYDERQDRSRLLTVGILLSGLFLTRYFALFFMPPVVLWVLVRSGIGGAAARLVRGGALLVLALLPISAWMADAYAKTGHLNGIGRNPSAPFPGIPHWNQLISFESNVRLTARTLFVDFFSLDKYAVHSVVDWPYSPTPLELAGGLLLVGAFAVALFAAWRDRERMQPRFDALLPAVIASLYLLMTIMLWTLGGMGVTVAIDPIHTRYLFPSYPCLLLAGFGAYAFVKTSDSRAVRWPFQLLYVLLLVVHLYRDATAPVLPLV